MSWLSSVARWGPVGTGNPNGFALTALCQQDEPDMLGIAQDDRAMTKRLLSQGLVRRSLTSAVGALPIRSKSQDELGIERLLWGGGVAMKPGKPLVFGKHEGTLVFGLPGNPVSAMVSFGLFVHHAPSSYG